MAHPIEESTEPSRAARGLSNDDIAGALGRVSTLLEAQRANPYRVQAYRRGAEEVRHSAREMVDLVAEGPEALEALPGIGETLAAAIRELVETGHLRYLHRLEGEVTAEALFRTVPGIGPETARRLHDELHVTTLEELEVAVHDGRLEKLVGFGPRRVGALRDVLSAMLSRSSRARGYRADRAGALVTKLPAIASLLAVDDEYHVAVEADALPRIAPKRFNPGHAAWLPILHTERDGFHFTALFSNTARAHDLHATHDWVVLYYEQSGLEGQCTVVTETHGPLSGQRVVRGREIECREHYLAETAA